MTLSKLPNNRWRARVWYQGRDVSVAKLLGMPAGSSWATKREAKAAYEQAHAMLRNERPESGTVREWWERWTTERAYQRPKESTNIVNRQMTRAFVERYGDLKLSQITRKTVGEWRRTASDGTLPPLRAMFNDAIEADLIDRNPFANLRLRKGRGNRDIIPPSQEIVWALIRQARRQAGPGFAAWLQVAAFTGMRPGELDALRWDRVDFDGSRIRVAEQFSNTSRTFTAPKNGKQRDAPLTQQAREALIDVAQSSEFCFVNLNNEHWSGSSRVYHWKAIRAAVGFEGSLYLATRHHAGWFMINVLNLSAAEVAIALGHEDGGRLVELLYGHRDRDHTLDRVVRAYEQRANVVPLPRREEAG